MKRLLILGILTAVLLVAECYPAQDVADQKEAHDTMTDGGEGDQGQRANEKPENLLKLIMTNDELQPNHSSQNKTMFHAPTKEPASEEASDIIQEMNGLLSKEAEAKEVEMAEYEQDEEDLFEGDIELTPEQKAMLLSDDPTLENWSKYAWKWRRDRIPYVLDRSLSSRARNAVTNSIREYHRLTCLRFRTRTSDYSYLRFIGSNQCSSAIGQQGGRQIIRLAPGCSRLIPAHEIFHALGRWHEQSRPDRDNFITINMNNIRAGKQHNFRKYGTNRADVQGIPYDYDSLMHYGAYAFAKNRNIPVIQPKDSSISLRRLGQRTRFSRKDILQVNKWYCPEYVVQLRGGSNKREGRVEINLQSSEWGTLCDDYFDINDANVICKFLGFPGATAAYSNSHFGDGSGPIWLDNLHCVGSETTLFDCPHGGFGIHNCQHNEDAGVQCTAPPMRLVGGSGSHEGRVEILLHGEWGTVCDNAWGLTDANVVCKQLGYSNGASAAHGSAQFGQGTGIIWFENVECIGSEAHLYDCLNDGVGIHNCGHSQDAGVTCIN